MILGSGDSRRRPGRRGNAMTVGRALVLVATLAAPSAAGAQFGGTPMPGTMPGGMPGFGGPPQAPPAVCQQLLALRDETQKYGIATQRANQRKVPVQEACRLFKSYLAAEQKFMKGIEENARTCGVPPDVLKQIKEGHANAAQIGAQVCEAAAQGGQVPRERGPTGDFWMPGDLERMIGPR